MFVFRTKTRKHSFGNDRNIIKNNPLPDPNSSLSLLLYQRLIFFWPSLFFCFYFWNISLTFFLAVPNLTFSHTHDAYSRTIIFSLFFFPIFEMYDFESKKGEDSTHTHTLFLPLAPKKKRNELRRVQCQSQLEGGARQHKEADIIKWA